jgi:hypothetical protein
MFQRCDISSLFITFSTVAMSYAESSEMSLINIHAFVITVFRVSTNIF